MTTTLVHLSDLHFGTEDPVLVAALASALGERPPELVVVSGDLTQRARAGEFRAARAFLDRLPAPALAVPGNHDLPLFNVARRALAARSAYRRHIARDNQPFLASARLRVLGLDTTRPEAWKSGRIRSAQVAAIGRLAGGPEEALRVLVTHHPFVPEPGEQEPARLPGRGAALAAAQDARVDLLLAGHLHLGFSAHSHEHHPEVARGMVVAQAGTACSHRRRGEQNSFNVVEWEPPRLAFTIFTWDGARFAPGPPSRFERSAAGWRTVVA